MRQSVLKQKSYQLAVRIVNLYKYLCEEKREYVLSKQILRSGTSVGAMVYEAEHAESRADFAHKLSIAQKEVNETIYWLELMRDTEYLSIAEFESISSDAVEIVKIIASSVKTTKSKL